MFFFFYFLWGVPLIWSHKYEGIDVLGQNCLGPIMAQGASNTSKCNNKKVCPLNADRNEGPSHLGVPFMSDGLLNEHKICL